MAFEALKKDLIDLNIDMRSYLETNEEYIKLKVFKIFMRSVTTIAQIVLIGAIVLLALFMLSMGVSLVINKALESFYIGFLITGGFFLLIALGFYIFRNKLNGPILRKFSEHYFERP